VTSPPAPELPEADEPDQPYFVRAKPPSLRAAFIVLACALAALVLSDLPSLRLFGGLSAFAMLAAMFADLTILRPTITFLMQRSRGYPSTESASSESSAIL